MNIKTNFYIVIKPILLYYMSKDIHCTKIILNTKGRNENEEELQVSITAVGVDYVIINGWMWN